MVLSGIGLEDALSICGMHRRLVRGEKPRTENRAVRAQYEWCSQASTISKTAGRRQR